MISQTQINLGVMMTMTTGTITAYFFVSLFFVMPKNSW